MVRHGRVTTGLCCAERDIHPCVMWMALALPLFVLPALVGFSRWEERVMSGPLVAARPSATD